MTQQEWNDLQPGDILMKKTNGNRTRVVRRVEDRDDAIVHESESGAWHDGLYDWEMHDYDFHVRP